MRNGTSSTSPRRPWMATAIWGWRGELFLTVGSFIILATSARICGAGPFLVAGAAFAALRLRPETRHQLFNHMKTNRDHRQLHAALWHCVVIGRNGSIPKVIRSASLPVGRRYLLQLPIGLHAALLQKSALELAAALGAREVRVKASPVNPRYVELAVIRANAFPKILASPLIQQWATSLWETLFFGVGQDGLPVSISLPEHNLLVGALNDRRRSSPGPFGATHLGRKSCL